MPTALSDPGLPNVVHDMILPVMTGVIGALARNPVTDSLLVFPQNADQHVLWPSLVIDEEVAMIEDDDDLDLDPMNEADTPGDAQMPGFLLCLSRQARQGLLMGARHVAAIGKGHRATDFHLVDKTDGTTRIKAACRPVVMAGADKSRMALLVTMPYGGRPDGMRYILSFAMGGSPLMRAVLNARRENPLEIDINNPTAPVVERPLPPEGSFAREIMAWTVAGSGNFIELLVLADRWGLTREMVSVAINDLERDGFINAKRRTPTPETVGRIRQMLDERHRTGLDPITLDPPHPHTRTEAGPAGIGMPGTGLPEPDMPELAAMNEDIAEEPVNPPFEVG